MPRCRSPPFLSEKQADKKEMEETEVTPKS